MKNFLKDSTINIISNLLIVIAIQLIAFPLLNKVETNDNFADVIVFYGISIVLATTLGTTLNNVRLLNFEQLGSNSKNLIFTKWLLISLVLNVIVIFIFLIIYNISLKYYLGMIIFSVLLTSRYYLVVYFREVLNYLNIFKLNLVVLIGYCIGIWIYYQFFSNYNIIFVTGELLGILYMLFFKKLYINLRISKNISKVDYKKIKKDYFNLVFVSLIINTVNYIDRIILLPILGPIAVSTYFIGSSASKMVSILTTPVNNVVLTYLSVNTERKLNIKKLYILFLIGVIPLFLIIKYSSVIIVLFLYPDKFDNVIKVLNLITILCVLSVYNSVIHPFSMKLLSSKTILFIQLCYGTFYVVITLISTLKYGLVGFCTGGIVVLILKLLFTMYIIKVSSK